jgi:hypothetical protein
LPAFYSSLVSRFSPGVSKRITFLCSPRMDSLIRLSSPSFHATKIFRLTRLILLSRLIAACYSVLRLSWASGNCGCSEPSVAHDCLKCNPFLAALGAHFVRERHTLPEGSPALTVRRYSKPPIGAAWVATWRIVRPLCRGWTAQAGPARPTPQEGGWTHMRMFNETNPNSVENKGTLEERTQTNPKKETQIELEFSVTDLFQGG